MTIVYFMPMDVEYVTSFITSKKISEYYQEIPQLHAADQPTVPYVRKSHRKLTVTRHQEDN